MSGTVAAVVAVLGAVLFTVGYTGQRPDGPSTSGDPVALAPTTPPLAPTTVPTAPAAAQPTTVPTAPAAAEPTTPTPVVEPTTIQPALPTAALSAEAELFAEFVADLGHVYSATQPGGLFDGCGPSEPASTSFFFTSGSATATLTVYETAQAAEAAFDSLLGVAAPCESLATLERISAVVTSPDVINVNYNLSGIDYYDVHLLRGRSVVAVRRLSTDVPLTDDLFFVLWDWSLDELTAPTPVPLAPPLATSPHGVFDPQPLPVGPVTVAVGAGVEFEVRSSRPALHFEGLSAIYVDEARSSEVNIFSPVMDSTGQLLADVDAVRAILTNSPLMLMQTGSTTVDGFPTQIFEGTPSAELQVIFYTDVASFGVPNAGWFNPSNLRLWLIDAPSGPVIITAEEVNGDIAQFVVALDLADTIIATARFGRAVGY